MERTAIACIGTGLEKAIAYSEVWSISRFLSLWLITLENPMKRLYGHRGAVPNYPTCKYADLIQNFFMARTLSVRQIGFDGQFERVAHKEFFADGLGKLKVCVV